MLDSVRLRLTLWHVTVFFEILLGFSTGTYLFVRAHFLDRADGILRSLGSATISIMRQGLSEGVPENLAARKALSMLDFPTHSIAIMNDQGDLIAERPPGFSARIPWPAGARNLPTDRKFRMFTVNASDDTGELHRIAMQRVVMAGKTYSVLTSRA